jgi:DNA ligase (NAD+)
VSKAGLDMDGVGRKWVQRLVEDGVLETSADLFTLEKTALLRYEGMGDRSAEKFIQAIARARREAPLWRLIAGLGIRHVGEQTARTLAARYRDLDALGQAPREELQDLDDVGPVVAESVYFFFRSDDTLALLRQFREAGFWPEGGRGAVEPSGDAPLAGKVFIFTGSLPDMTRDQAQALVEERGGSAVKSISKKVDYVVAGDKAGSKVAKAEKLGLTIIDFAAFMELIQADE